MHYRNIILPALVISTELAAARPIKRDPDWKSPKSTAVAGACGAAAFAASVVCTLSGSTTGSHVFNALSATGGAVAAAGAVANAFGNKKPTPDLESGQGSHSPLNGGQGNKKALWA